MGEGDSNAARLEKIQGGIDVIRVQLEHSNKLADERHDAIKADIVDLRQVQHRHGNEITNIKAREHQREGERKGLATGGRVMWGMVGFMPPAGMLLAKLLLG